MPLMPMATHLRLVRKASSARVISRRAALLAELTPAMQRQILRAIAETVNGLVLVEVRRALEANDLNAAAAAIPWEEIGEPILRTALPPLLRDGVEGAGRATARLLLEDLDVPDSPFEFDVVRESAGRWIRTEAGTLIRDLGETRLESLRLILDRAILDSISPLDAARLIRDARLVGLTPRDATAVLNFRARQLRDGVRRDGVEELTRRYAKRLLNTRTEAIARTEMVRAYAAGQRELWAQALDQGVVGPEALQEWVTVDPCRICAPLEGVTAPIGGRFYPGGYAGPGEPHPRCECMTILLPFGKERGRAA